MPNTADRLSFPRDQMNEGDQAPARGKKLIQRFATGNARSMKHQCRFDYHRGQRKDHHTIPQDGRHTEYSQINPHSLGRDGGRDFMRVVVTAAPPIDVCNGAK